MTDKDSIYSLSPRRIEDLLELNLRVRGQKTAIVFQEREYTYDEVSSLADEVAIQLTEANVRAGDRVAAVCMNGPQMVCALFGAMRAKAVFVPLHPLSADHHVASILRDSRPKTIIADDPKRIESVVNLAGMECALISSNNDCQFHFVKSIEADRTSSCVPSGELDDLALLIYTSGSTGLSKGVMSLHRNVLFAAKAINAILDNRTEDRVLNALPFSFDYGLYQIFLTFLSGASLVLHSAVGAGILAVPHLLNSQKITGFPAVPSMLSLLLRTGLFRRIKPTHLRYITSTGEILSGKCIEQLRSLFPEVAIFSMYGLTECKRVSICPSDDLESRPGTVGLPLPETSVDIVDAEGMSVGCGEIGELVVRGNHVMAGYWGETGACCRFMRDEAGKRFLSTGDLFSRDEEGFLYFHGRRDEVVKIGSVKVNPKEVQRAISELPEVAESCVFVSGGEQGCSLVHILVVAEVGYDDQDVLESCGREVRAGLFPRRFTLVRELYKTENGKIDVGRHVLELEG